MYQVPSLMAHTDQICLSHMKPDYTDFNLELDDAKSILTRIAKLEDDLSQWELRVSRDSDYTPLNETYSKCDEPWDRELYAADITTAIFHAFAAGTRVAMYEKALLLSTSLPPLQIKTPGPQSKATSR